MKLPSVFAALKDQTTSEAPGFCHDVGEPRLQDSDQNADLESGAVRGDSALVLLAFTEAHQKPLSGMEEVAMRGRSPIQADMQERRLAIVAQVYDLKPHPNADRLDLLQVEYPNHHWPDGHPYTWQVVTGKHYRNGQLGVLVLPPALLPGWLAEDLWLFGRARAHQEPWFEVKALSMRGEPSCGLFCGKTYAKDYTDSRSIDLYEQRLDQGAVEVAGGVIHWPMWRDHWKPGDDVSTYLGVTRPHSSVAERRLVKPEVAGSSTDESLGSTPAVGSISPKNRS